MHLEPYSELNWAYQLHYYVCFQTHRHQSLFVKQDRISLLQRVLDEICENHNYHLLQSKLFSNHIRCLLSLRPNQSIAVVVQKIKGNLSREYGVAFNAIPPLWARGYLARSAGRVHVERVKSYLNSQSEHHGYHKRVRPPVFRYRATNIPRLTAAHSFFDLTQHLVFATRYRAGVFDSTFGEALAKYWLRVAAKRGFAIEQVSILPDHAHLMVKTVPKISVEDCALILMNNGQYFVGKHFSSALVQAGIERLWQASAYAGTCGQMTTALLKSFLSQAD